MINIILATTKDGGIGLDGKLPWNIREEIKLYKSIIKNSTLVCGRKTLISIPFSNKDIYYISRHKLATKNIGYFKSLDEVFKELEGVQKKVFIIGGGEIFQQVFDKYLDKITYIYISVINKNYKCDVKIKIPYPSLCILEKKEFDEFCFYKLISNRNNFETKYISLGNKILSTLISRPSRNESTLSLFGEKLEFNLQQEFPLLTTRKILFKAVVEELIFFLKGETDSKILEQKNINIWKKNTTRKFLDNLKMTDRPVGIMGPMYGYQWRFYGSKYDYKTGYPINKGIDQLSIVINKIKKEPYSRRILMTTYNPEQVEDGVLYPCHSIILQFYVDDNYLDMFCFNRSSDYFHGLPFNITSSAILLSIVAKLTNLEPRKLIISLGDVHIYDSHISSVKKMLNIFSYPSPKLVLNKKLDLNNLDPNYISIENYKYNLNIKTKMVV